MRRLRKGDIVTATGTVTDVFADDYAMVCLPSGDTFHCRFTDLTLVEPAEPPVGSVVVKDGVAWMRGGHWWYTTHGVSGGAGAAWSDLSDGDVIFTPGGDS